MSEANKQTFEELIGFGVPHERDTTNDSPLCDCAKCSSNLVYPYEWSEYGEDYWEVKLHCPNCDDVDRGIFSNSQVNHFDTSLDHGTAQLKRSLHWITGDIMSREVEAFAEALHGGHVTPEDLGRVYP